ncbi:serine/threonine protein kinase [Actinomadura sp. WMMB 499]|nr:serine/threonine protein kinase [Actinomadura sp. WMMB 499]
MPEALPLQPGDPRRLGSYEVTGRLGVGEQGAVFLGADPAGRTVAVKLLHVRLSGEPAARSRFTAAFEAARRVSGFCTAAILDADVEGDRAYIVSECVDGPSLQQLVDEEGPRGGAVVERLAVGTAVALAAVHRSGAVHHDLKPANVLLGRDGPKMCDIGVHGALDAVMGAPHWEPDPSDPSRLSYRAPEQLSGLRAESAADVFAWAATLLFAAAGAAPFGDGPPSETVQKIMYDDPDLSAAPEALRGVLADALAKDPAARPTAKGLLERLLDPDGPLAARMPAALVDEGRALAAGAPAAPSPAPSAPSPAPAASPAPPSPPPAAQPPPPQAAAAPPAPGAPQPPPAAPPWEPHHRPRARLHRSREPRNKPSLVPPPSRLPRPRPPAPISRPSRQPPRRRRRPDGRCWASCRAAATVRIRRPRPPRTSTRARSRPRPRSAPSRTTGPPRWARSRTTGRRHSARSRPGTARRARSTRSTCPSPATRRRRGTSSPGCAPPTTTPRGARRPSRRSTPSPGCAVPATTSWASRCRCSSASRSASRSSRWCCGRSCAATTRRSRPPPPTPARCRRSRSRSRGPGPGR